MENTNKPTIKVRNGNVTATVFTNIVNGQKDGKPYSFTSENIVLQKSYKDGEEWKNTSTLGKNDLPKAIMVLEEVARKLLLEE